MSKYEIVQIPLKEGEPNTIDAEDIVASHVIKRFETSILILVVKKS